MLVSQQKAKLQGLVAALEAQVSEAVGLATAEGQGGDGFQAYERFRRRVADFHALGSLVHDRLGEVDAPWAEELRGQHARLDALMNRLLAQASVRFLTALCARPALPLGAREVLTRELGNLEALEGKLREAGEGAADLLPTIAGAKAMLRDAMARVPALAEF